MTINLNTTVAQRREDRLGTIIRWEGKASDLLRESRQACGGCGNGRLCELESPYTEGSHCSDGPIYFQLVSLQESVLIQHAPFGCAANQVGMSSVIRGRAAADGREFLHPSSICTNLGEEDVVFGGAARLDRALHEAWERYHPPAIFISTSCVAAIIGDDVDAVASACQEEFGIPVVPLHCEGFKSSTWSNAWDISAHGVVRQIVHRNPARKQEDLINVSHLGGEDVFTPLLGQLGLRVNLLIYETTIANLEQLSEAAASTTMCYTHSYITTALEQEFGVPEIKSPLPYGLAGTDAWLREIAQVTRREDRVEELIRREHNRIRPKLEELRERLAGKRSWVAAGAAYGHGVITTLRELGIEVPSAVSYHHDPEYDSRDPRQDTLAHLIETTGDVENFTVTNNQNFQLYVSMTRAKPDFVVHRHGFATSSLALNRGIPTISLSARPNFAVGYQGLLNMGEEILGVLANTRFYRDMAGRLAPPYKDWWMAQTDPFALSRNADEAKAAIHA